MVSWAVDDLTQLLVTCSACVCAWVHQCAVWICLCKVCLLVLYLAYLDEAHYCPREKFSMQWPATDIDIDTDLVTAITFVPVV